MSAALVLSEWDRKTVRVGEPSRADLDLVGRLETDLERKLEIRWLKDGRLEVRSSSWVGVVRLSGVTIQVRPKYAGDELGVLRLLQYSGGYRSLKRTAAQRSLPTGGVDFLDLLCHLLAEETVALLREGAIHDYTTEEESLPSLRGSLLIREQVTKRFGQLDSLECRFDEFHADVIENQMIRTGLLVASRACRDRGIRREVHRLENVLSDLCQTGPTETSHYRSRISYGRRNERYRSAHELCYLLLDHLGVEDLYSDGAIDSFAFLVDMNRVFESFVTALIKEAFDGYGWFVASQRREHSVVRDRRSQKRYSSIIPDIVLTDRKESIPFDCKYKLYGLKKISSADIYQSFLYAYALAGKDLSTARGGIIYPADETKASPHLGISQVGGPTTAALTGIAIDLLDMQKAIGDKTKWPATLSQIRQILGPVLAGED